MLKVRFSGQFKKDFKKAEKRVLGVVAKADGIKEAVDKAYAGVDMIKFADAHFRHDIAHWALERLNK